VSDDVVENAGETDAVPPRLVLQLWGVIFTFEAAAVRWTRVVAAGLAQRIAA
jgi:hypothetical protein